MSDASLDNGPRSPEDQGPPASQPAGLPAPGAQLAARRQELGWTVEQVASRLNLAPRQIEALEADHYAALPGLASTRGFVRAYAKLLRLDAEPLVAALTAAATPAEEALPLRRPLPSAAFTPVKLAPMKRGGSRAVMVVVVVVVLAVVALAAAWQMGLLHPLAEGMGLTGKNGEPATVVTPPIVPSPAAPAVVGGPAADSAASAPGAAAGTPAAAAPPAPPAAETPSAPAAQPAETPKAAAPAAASAGEPEQASTASDAASVVVKAKEDCWIEVRRDPGSNYSRTIPAGSTERIEIKGALTVVLGNASGIDVMVRGKPVDVRARAKNNVARLDLK